MSHIKKPDSGSVDLQKAFFALPAAGQLAFLKDVAANPDMQEDARILAVQIAQSLVNPFGGKDLAMAAPVTETSLKIPASFIGKKYGNEPGLFLGYFYLNDAKDEQPIFVLKLTDDMTFNQAVASSGAEENGYKADARSYDAYQGLRSGKTTIAPFDIVQSAYENKDKGAFAKMFKDAGWILTSSSPPDNPHGLQLVTFRNGDENWVNKVYIRAPSLLVRAGLTL